MQTPKTPKRKKLRVDGHEIVLEAADLDMGTSETGERHLTSSYSVEFDGVRRGFVCYGYGRNRSNPGWKAYVFGVSHVGSGRDVPRLQARGMWGGSSRDEVASMFVGLMERNLAPTIEEATRAVERRAEEIVQERERRNRDRLAERKEREDRKIHDLEDLDEMVEGLRSIRARLSGSLTNRETDVVERAIARLAGERERSDRT